MPWTAADAEKHKKGLTKKQRKKWAVIANAVREKCMTQGDKDCDSKAVIFANSKFSVEETRSPEFKIPFNPVLGAEFEQNLREFIRKNFTPPKLETIPEMEIFRAGTHNGDEFTTEDLNNIAQNFHALNGEVRPKLKITHRDEQETLGGLASYGDIVDVYVKPHEDGSDRLYAKIENVPPEVTNMIRERRFPERSIEIYPEFKVGSKKDSPLYKNVLKAIALLGHEMPAVTGMAPIKLSEEVEGQKTRLICFSDVCLCPEAAEKHLEKLFDEANIHKLFAETERKLSETAARCK